MLFEELNKFVDGQATYAQFLEIEAVYMKKDSMSKKQAVRLWRRRYGKKNDIIRHEELRQIKELVKEFIWQREWFDGYLQAPLDYGAKHMSGQEYYNQSCQEAYFTFYYKDGTGSYPSGEDIFSGEKVRLQNIAYARVDTGWEYYDTFMGTIPSEDTEEWCIWNQEYTDAMDDKFLKKNSQLQMDSL
jgi:hypothetical protein